ncbi:MAG: hypothetical protein M1816_007627, partial [Peltula sp. TS41687]
FALKSCKEYLPPSIAPPDNPEFDVSFLERRRTKPDSRSNMDKSKPNNLGQSEEDDDGPNRLLYSVQSAGIRLMKTIGSAATKATGMKPIGAFGDLAGFRPIVVP